MLQSLSKIEGWCCSTCQKVEEVHHTGNRWWSERRFYDIRGTHRSWYKRQRRNISCEKCWLCYFTIQILGTTLDGPRSPGLPTSLKDDLLLFLQKRGSSFHRAAFRLLEWIFWSDLLRGLAADPLQRIFHIMALSFRIDVRERRGRGPVGPPPHLVPGWPAEALLQLQSILEMDWTLYYTRGWLLLL